MSKPWAYLGRPAGRQEHSLWECLDEPGRIYVADNSGRTPDSTDDGALYLEGDLILRKGFSTPIVAHVSVVRADESRGYTALHMNIALWLIENRGFRARFGDDDLRVVGRLLAKAHDGAEARA